MHEGGDETARNRNRQSYETLLVCFYGTLSEDARPRCLNVKARETKCAAHQVHERNKPRELVKLLSLRSDSVPPNISKHGRRETKGDNIGDRVKLNSDLGGCLGEARDATVYHVKQERKPNRDCRGVEVRAGSQYVRSRSVQQLKTTERRHHGQKPHGDIRRRERRRNQIEPFPQSPTRRIRRFVF